MVEMLRIQACLLTKMTKEALMRFPAHSRKYFANRDVFHSKHRIFVPIHDMDTEQKLAQVIWDNYGSGRFRIMTFTKGKTKTHIKAITLCRIILHDLGDGEFSFQMTQTWRLKYRYKWFWKGN